jgi:hypothetical protein
LVNFASLTLLLAGVGAYPSTNSGKGHSPAEHLQSLLELALGDESNITLGIDPGGTGNPAWWIATLIYNIFIGNCLRKRNIGGLSFTEVLVKFTI